MKENWIAYLIRGSGSARAQGKARVLMEHLEAERRHISIRCRSDCVCVCVCVFSRKRRGTKTDIPQRWPTSEWRELLLQHKSLRHMQFMARDSSLCSQAKVINKLGVMGCISTAMPVKSNMSKGIKLSVNPVLSGQLIKLHTLTFLNISSVQRDKRMSL